MRVGVSWASRHMRPQAPLGDVRNYASDARPSEGPKLRLQAWHSKIRVAKNVPGAYMSTSARPIRDHIGVHFSYCKAELAGGDALIRSTRSIVDYISRWMSGYSRLMCPRIKLPKGFSARQEVGEQAKDVARCQNDECSLMRALETSVVYRNFHRRIERSVAEKRRI